MKLLLCALLSSLIGLCLGSGGSVGGGGSGDGGSLSETENTKLLKENTPIMLICNSNATDVSTKWKKNETELEGDSHYQVFKNSSLYIASPQSSDVGEYSCAIGDEEPNYFHIVELTLHKKLPESTTVLENDKLKLTCQVEGNPIPNVIWIKDGQPLQNAENSTRLVFEENDKHVPNASLLIKPILKSDFGNYSCLIYQFSIHANTTTLVRVKDIYAALWPFLGIVAEVTILCAIIFIYEKRRIKPNLAQADLDDVNEEKNAAEAKETEVRQRK